MPTETFTTAGTAQWTAPVGVYTIRVELWGGGGAGAQRSSNNSGAAGGQGGAHAIGFAMAVTAGQPYTYTIGAGGTDGATPVNGGASTFTANLGDQVIAPGGASAAANSQTAPYPTQTPTGDSFTVGGSGANGTSTYSGGGGEGGGTTDDGYWASGVTGGTGRDGGDGGNGRTTSAAGFPGVQPGGGGGGGYRTTSVTRAGGAGGPGLLIITYLDYVFPAESGPYTVTGVASAITLSLPTDPLEYATTGADVGLTQAAANAPLMPAAAAPYTVVGDVLDLLAGWHLDADAPAGDLALTGDDAAVFKGFGLSAEEGGTSIYTWTGIDLTALAVSMEADGAGGAYTFGYTDINLVRDLGTGDYTIAAAQEAYLLTGAAVPQVFSVPVPIDFVTYTGDTTLLDYGSNITGAFVDALPGTYVYDNPVAMRIGIMHPGDPGLYTLTGVSAALRRGMAALVGSYVIPPATADLWFGRSVAAATDAYTLTGDDVTFGPLTPVMPADGGVYDLIGYSVEFPPSVKALFPEAAAYAVTVGDEMVPRYGRFVAIATDLYQTTGGDLGMRAARALTLDDGFTTLTTFAATLRPVSHQTFTVAMDAGAYAVTGQVAGLTPQTPTAYALAIDTGAYAVTGQDAVPHVGARSVAAATDAYALTGDDVTFARTRVMKFADSGAYHVSGGITRVVGPDGLGAGGDDMPGRRRRRRGH